MYIWQKKKKKSQIIFKYFHSLKNNDICIQWRDKVSRTIIFQMTTHIMLYTYILRFAQ